jgi:hypothetical protein
MYRLHAAKAGMQLDAPPPRGERGQVLFRRLPGFLADVSQLGFAHGQVYKQHAAQDGVQLDGAPHNVREFSLAGLPGGYRRLLHRPADLRWRLLAYTDADAPLAATDLDRLQGVDPPVVHPITPGALAASCSQINKLFSLAMLCVRGEDVPAHGY